MTLFTEANTVEAMIRDLLCSTRVRHSERNGVERGISGLRRQRPFASFQSRRRSFHCAQGDGDAAQGDGYRHSERSEAK